MVSTPMNQGQMADQSAQQLRALQADRPNFNPAEHQYNVNHAQGVELNNPHGPGVRRGEALETVDVTKGGETPIPEMNKSKDNGGEVKPDVAEGEGSPHPTKRVDILEPIKSDRGDDFLEGTKAVTETQDVEKSQETKPPGGSSTWTQNNGVSPVSAVDPDKNPIRELLESDYDGFTPQDHVQSAIADFDKEKE